MASEAVYISLLCGLLGGAEPETRHHFDVYGYDRPRRIYVDCETPTHVIEIGLDDSRSARDSLHQAGYAAVLTGKTPMVILIDRDGDLGRYEQEMRDTSALFGVPFARCSAGFLESWSATAGRSATRQAQFNDLPSDPTIASRCPIGPMLDPDATRAAGG